MSPSCYQLNFIQQQNVSDNLDKYVVLAFFLTLILTIAFVLLLVKYITYNMLLDREREAKIAKRTCLPVLPVEPSDVENSDDDTPIWSSEDEEDTIPINDDTPSIASILETNYVEKSTITTTTTTVGKDIIDSTLNDTIDDETANHKVSDLDVRWLAEVLALPASFGINDTSTRLLFDIFLPPQNKLGTSTVYLSSMFCFDQLLNQIITLRDFVSLQIINFTIDLLFEQRVLEQDQSLQMKAKYEQKLEPHDDCLRADTILISSQKIFLVIQEFVKDLQMALVDRKVLAETVTLLFNQPLDCLKVLLLTSPDHGKACVETSKLYYSGITHFENVLLMITGRSAFFRDAIQKNPKSTQKLLVDFDKEIGIIMDNFKSDFQKLFTSSAFRKSNTNSLFIQLEREINALKLKFRNSKGRNVSKKLEALGECLKGLLVSHLENHGQFLVDDGDQGIGKYKQALSRLQKATIQRMQEVEEKYLHQLQEDLKFTESELNKVVDDTRDSLKSVLKQYDEIKLNTADLFVSRQEHISRLTNFVIDHTVKLVSTNYRISLSANVAWFKSWPVLSENAQTKMERLSRGKLGMVSFDVVVASMKYFFQEIDKRFILEIPKLDVEQVLKQPVDLFVESTIVKHFDSSFALPDEFLDSYHATLHTVVNRAFDGVQQNLHQALEKEVQLATQKVYQQNLDIFKLYHEQIEPTALPIDEEKTIRKKKKDYLSRKQSSLKEKTLMDRFNELYDGMKEVKEHRYQEKLQELQNELLPKSTTKASKNSTKDDYTKVLLQHQSILFRRREYIEKKLSCLFTMDQYYMRDMLFKKMTEMIDDHDNGESGSPSTNQDDRNEDHDNDRGNDKRGLQRKPNSGKSKLVRPKKAVKAPGIKKRKSRRIRDSEA